jgi:heme/copper-type cytochrome/quinol oxidase subunit 1
MNSRRLYDQVMTIFGTVMIFFYLGIAYVLLFTTLFSHVDIALRGIFAFPLLLYGIFRAVVSYQKIRENFFLTDDD